MDYKLKRNVLSLAKKIELLAKSSRPGVARKDLAKEFGIDVSCVCRILKNRDTLLSEWLKGGNQDRKRKRDGKDARIEDALFRWFTAARNHGISISGPLLMEKARDLAVVMGIEFEPTSGWLSRWKKRNNIGNNRYHKADPSLHAVDNWYLNTLPSLLSEYSPEDIYKVDETAIFFREMPDRVLESNDSAGLSRGREYVTVIICANSTGTEKMRLLVIGRSKRPRCFKGVTMDALPVQYEADLYTRLSINIFQKWVHGVDVKMKQAGRKIILFIDHCTAHTAGDLDNVKIVILPPKSPPTLQPMDQEVIRHLRHHYRKQIFTKIIRDFDGDPQSAIDLARSITILDATHMLNAAWKDVEPETIRKCFIQAGIWKEFGNNEFLAPFPERKSSSCTSAVGFQPFPLVSIKTEPTEEVADTEICRVVIQHRGKLDPITCPIVEEETEEEDDDGGPEIVPPTTREVWEMMRRIRNYVETREKTDFEWFYSFERRLESLSEASERQSRTTDPKQEL
uniref:Tigger transposable element-derived protein 3-like n=1 Tax=Geotrypetes seraphini TaxID=260995 RepID=A0A6P8QWM2_GEOSA|nr:tigger transposable element-derived protein 3-like [Geotrypetes seraphini]